MQLATNPRDQNNEFLKSVSNTSYLWHVTVKSVPNACSTPRQRNSTGEGTCERLEILLFAEFSKMKKSIKLEIHATAHPSRGLNHSGNEVQIRWEESGLICINNSDPLEFYSSHRILGRKMLRTSSVTPPRGLSLGAKLLWPCLPDSKELFEPKTQ